MKNFSWLPIFVLIFLMSCSARYKTSISQKKFHTPPNWSKPIEKTPIAENSDTFRPDFEKTKDNFKPVFKDSEQKNSITQAPESQMSGYASWYGPGFHGKKTANGERYNQNKMTAAHKILPMNTWVKVTNLENDRSAIVRINDRGPYKKNRIIDLTRSAAEKLGFKEQGTARVSLKVLKYPKDFDPAHGLTPYKQVVIQLAVFKAKSRAQTLKDQLAKKYYDIPFLVDENQQNRYQVIAGPYNVRSKAVQIANALKSDGVDNFVRSYRK